MAMGVNFNGLRRNLCNSFDEVLRCAIQCREENGDKAQFQELADALDQLRFCVASVALCYDEHGNKDVLGDRTLLSMNEDEKD